MVTEDVRVRLLDGSLKNHPNCLAGIYKGYNLIIKQIDTGMLFSFNASSEYDKNYEAIKTFLAQKSETEGKIQTYHAEENTIQVVLPPELETEDQIEFSNRMVDEIVEFLRRNYYNNCCSYCGKAEEPLHCFEISNEYYYICDACSHQIKESLQNAANQKSNFVLGVIGAILGSMIGCSLWLIIYKLGYIASIAGAAMGICAMKGYGLFGKKLDRKGVIVSAIVMLIMVFLSNRLALSWEVYDALNGYGFPTSFADIFINLGDLIKELNLTSDYYTDLVVGYALTIFCSASSICEAFSYSDSTNYSMNKME